jgi:hypothetical protein
MCVWCEFCDVCSAFVDIGGLVGGGCVMPVRLCRGALVWVWASGCVNEHSSSGA